MVSAQKTIPPPDDVKAVPADAKKTAQRPGLQGHHAGHGQAASHEHERSDGALHRLDDRRKDVRQLGRARRAGDIPTNGVIKGWTEGVQLMVEGEKTRFWIPERSPTGTPGAVRHARVRHRAAQDQVGSAGQAGTLPARPAQSTRLARPRRNPIVNPAAGLLESVGQRAFRLVGHRADARPGGLRLTQSSAAARPRLSSSTLPPMVLAASASFSIAASRVVGDRLRRSRPAPSRAGERRREVFDPADERFHPLAVGVWIEIGAGKGRRPARHDARRRRLRTARRAPAPARDRRRAPRSPAASGPAASGPWPADLPAVSAIVGTAPSTRRCAVASRPSRRERRHSAQIASRAATRSARAMSCRWA